MLGRRWNHLLYLEKEIASFEARIEEKMRPFEAEIKRLDEIPGVNGVVAQAMIAEIGTDMSRFATADHLASWAGLCPGNNESAGKRKSGRTLKANPWLNWLKRSLSQAAWAAARTKNTYLSSPFKLIAKRRGKKRAMISGAHTILTTAYYILSRSTRYVDLGGDYFDRLRPERTHKYHVRRLESMGFQVNLSPAAPPA